MPHKSAEPTVAIRAIKRADVTPLSIALTRAFTGDPYFEWLVTGSAARERRIAAMLAADLRYTFLESAPKTRRRLRSSGVSDGAGRLVEVVSVDGIIAGAALWEGPSAAFTVKTLATLPTVIALSRSRSLRIWSGIGALDRHRPATSHWYLHTLAVTELFQGRGLASALLTQRLAEADRASMPVYVESSKDSNVPLYQRFGFVATAEVRLPGGPLITCMIRLPDPERLTGQSV